jgi:hypothetical protein
MEQHKPIIRLWQLTGIGLIIAHPSGVLYANQTGGYACHHPAMEGSFVPLMDPDIDQQKALEDYFTGPKWHGHCYNGIDDETADVVDGVLATSPLTRRLTVNRAMLKDSQEAWIHVHIAPDGEENGYEEFYGFPSGRGVITWENSD